MKITADQIIAMNPCRDWPHGVIRKRIGSGKTPTEIASDTSVPIKDRRWLLTNYAARHHRKVLVLWAAGCAQNVRDRITDEDSRDAADCAVQTAVAWAEGCATEQDCRAAYAYASAYAAAAADDAAYASAYAAAAAAAAAAYAYASAYAADDAAYASAYADASAYAAAAAAAAYAYASAYAAAAAAAAVLALAEMLEAA